MFFEYIQRFLFHKKLKIYSELKKQQLSTLNTVLFPSFLNSNYNILLQIPAFLKATEYAHPVTGSGLNCVTSVIIWKFIQGLVTAKQEQNLDLSVPWAKFLLFV